MAAAVGSRPSSQASVMGNHGPQHSHERTHSSRLSHPSLANISVRSFSDFRAQTSSIQAQSPPSVRRKPLPANASPQLSCFSPTETTFGDIIDAGRAPESTTANVADIPGRASGGSTAQHTLGQTHRERAPSNSFGHNTQSPPLPSSNLSPTSVQLLPRHRGRPSLPSQLPATTTTNASDSTLNVPRLNPRNMSYYGEGLTRSVSDNTIGSSRTVDSHGSSQTVSPSKRKNSPSNKFSSFFGWKSSPRPGTESPSTIFTEGSISPAGSPVFFKSGMLDRSVSAPRLNAPSSIDIHAANDMLDSKDLPATPFPESANGSFATVEELEKELREVSSELANSIRREMELEDENDRLKGDPSMVVGELTRRTSDYFSDSGSSAIKPNSEADNRIEELERKQRKLEQEKAQIRADYSTRLGDALRQRHDMEVRLTSVERDARENSVKAAAGAQSGDRIRELETFLEEARRRLGQERRSHDNFEDLLAALRAELAQIRSERDNLVEEVVPQLKARVDGLEQEAAEASNLRYENTRMQQELGYDSTMRSPIHPSVKRTGSLLNRSGSVKGRAPDSGDAKDIEDQRDALHKALKIMIRRHEAQKREHARTVQRLIADRDASATISRGQGGFSKRVANLKEDMVTLRRKADDTLTQKWQCEDNLGGVKMALDRAEQETRSLRAMLGGGAVGNGNGLGIKLAGEPHDSPMSMIKVIRRSIQLAETERDSARREAGAYRRRARSITDGRVNTELLGSADRLDDLANRLDACVRKNIDLQERLGQALEESEKEQAISTGRVVEMQSRLKTLEDQLVSAQQDSESSFTVNEEVAKSIGNNLVPYVTRLPANGSGIKAGRTIFSGKAPRLNVTRSGKAQSLQEATRTEALQRATNALEEAILTVDKEMKRVVEKVETMRAEIVTLQGERDSASQTMKRLQGAISEEQQHALSLLV